MPGGRGGRNTNAQGGKDSSRRKTRSQSSHYDSDEEDQQNSSHSQPSDITATLLQLVSKITDLITSNSTLTQTNIQLTSKVTELENNQKSLLERIEALEQRSGQWEGPKARPTGGDIDAVTNLVSDEILARKEKELNLVIYGLAELESQDDEPVTDADEQAKVEELLKTDLKVDQPGLTRVFRMGKKRTPSDRPRPLKVMFAAPGPRTQTLDKARDLGKLPEEHRLRKVYIRPDWTQMQRDQDYHKRQSARQNRERGTSRDSQGAQPEHRSIPGHSAPR